MILKIIKVENGVLSIRRVYTAAAMDLRTRIKGRSQRLYRLEAHQNGELI